MSCISTLLFTVEYSVRLVDDTTGPNHGYLEILDQDGEWRRVCYDNWNRDQANVVCRQLGYQQLWNNSSGIGYISCATN